MPQWSSNVPAIQRGINDAMPGPIKNNTVVKNATASDDDFPLPPDLEYIIDCV
jgi:hypothetical protein